MIRSCLKQGCICQVLGVFIVPRNLVVTLFLNSMNWM
jgi:hypothetical protein